MRVDAESIASMAQRDGQRAIAERAGAIGEAVSHIQRQVRLILKQLRPEGLAEVGLAQAIANLAAFWQRRHDGIAIHLDIDAARHGFGAEADAAIYRLVQESLTNAARHGGAKQVWIGIAANDSAIQVTVEDDGAGLSPPGGDGMGLKGMRERLAALSGTLTLGNRAHGGARIAAVIPRATQDADAVLA
jgi:two-component system sensor histidine kinase UhpB